MPLRAGYADSLAPKRIGELTFAILTRHAAQAVQVSDNAIRQAQELWDRLRLVAEPGGCAGAGGADDRRILAGCRRAGRVVISARTPPRSASGSELPPADVLAPDSADSVPEIPA